MSDPPPCPAVSVLICVYNGESYLESTLDCVLAQSCAGFELIAVDDGSTDGSVAILKRYSDARLRVIRQPNSGAAAALRTALGEARGDYIAFLDQDDLWTPDKLAAHLDLLEKHPEIDLTFSWYQVISPAGRPIGLQSHRYRGTVNFPGLLADFVIGATSNIVARRSAIERAGGVDPALPRYYDMDLCLRIALLRPRNMLAIPRDLMFYRRHASQITQDLPAMEREWELLLDKMRRLSPDVAASVEPHARQNMNRYFAYLAYENLHFAQGLKFLRRAFRVSPGRFLADGRNWLTSAACLSGLLAPAGLHRSLERMAGLRRDGK